MQNLVEVDCDVCGSNKSKQLMALLGSAYHQCTTCGLIYSKWIAANYDHVNETAFTQQLDKYAAKVDKKNRRYKKRLKRFDRYKTDGNFLEFGCNAGAMLVAARDAGWHVKGVDLSASASTYAREQLGLDVHTGTVESANYPDDFFDVIYNNATLEHVQHPLSTLKECARILKPGGVLYTNTVNWDSYTRKILGANWLLINPINHIHLFTPANVKTLCEYSGLKHLKTWTTGARVQANAADSNFRTPWYLNLMKGPLSMMTRLTKKGDSIEFLATKL